MAKALPDQSLIVHVIFDETRHDIATLETVSQLDCEMTRLGLKCTYFEKDAPAGAQQIGQREQHLLNANWIIIVYSEPTEHSSDMFIFEENMVMSEAVNRGELCIIFLIQPFMLNFNSRGFPSVVIQGTEWLDEVVKQVDQIPAQLTSIHFDDIESYRKLYAELQKARNLTASDPLLYHRRSAHYGFPFSQIQSLYFNFLSLISWSSAKAESSSSTPLPNQQNQDSETSEGDVNPDTLERGTLSVNSGTQTDELDDPIKGFPVLKQSSYFFIIAAYSVWFISVVIHDIWLDRKTLHGIVHIITCNGINFVLLGASGKHGRRNFFYKLMLYSCMTSVLHSSLWCLYLAHVKHNGYDFACIFSLFEVISFIRFYFLLTMWINVLGEALKDSTFIQLCIYFLYSIPIYLILLYEGISVNAQSTPKVQKYAGVSPLQKPNLNHCLCTTPYLFLKAAELLVEVGYLSFYIRCGRSFLQLAIYMCFKKKLAFVTKWWGIETVLYYFIRFRYSGCAFAIMISMLKVLVTDGQHNWMVTDGQHNWMTSNTTHFAVDPE